MTTRAAGRTLLVLVAILALSVAAPALAQEGKSYSVVFKAADGQTADGCVTFSDSAPGTLTMSGHGGPATLTWHHTGRGNHPDGFQANGKQGQFIASISGKAINGDAGIKGDMIMTQQGNPTPIVLKFSGTAVSPACS